jgi:hypothetical protein
VKAVKELRQQKRPIVYVQEESTWLIPSDSYMKQKEPKEGVEALWQERMQAGDEERMMGPDSTILSWPRYKYLQASVYELKRHHAFPNFLSCTCPVGVKDEVCKHALVLMEDQGLVDKPEVPLEPARKRGKQKKFKKGLGKE